MKQEHSGIGGLFFIMVTAICAAIMMITVRLSFDSQAVSMADNMAYITAINVVANGYMDECEAFHGHVGPADFLPYTEHRYAPVADFNHMLKSSRLGIGENPCTDAYIVFDGKTAIVQYGTFETTLHSMVRPHQQEATIEVD